MIRQAINAELARRAGLSKPKHPSTPYALAQVIGKHSQSVYRMLDDKPGARPSFFTEHADSMLEALDLRIVRGR